MFSFSDRTINGVYIIKEGLLVMLRYKISLFFASLIIIFNLSAFILFLMVEYNTYGMHIFDFSTLKELINLDFWEHFGHNFSILMTLFITSTITYIIRVCYHFTMLSQFRNKPVSLSEVRAHYKVTPTILRLAAIKALGFIGSALFLMKLPKHIEQLRLILIGKEPQSPDAYENQAEILTLPFIVDKKMRLISAVEKSHEELEKKYGKNTTPNFNFFIVSILLFIFILIITMGIVHFALGYGIFLTFIITLVLWSSVDSIIESSTNLFDCAVYNYTQGYPPTPFDPKKIKRIYSIKEELL